MTGLHIFLIMASIVLGEFYNKRSFLTALNILLVQDSVLKILLFGKKKEPSKVILIEIF